MADKKISELSPLTGALNVADALPIADDSASQTKKISPKDLIQAGITLIDAGSIPADKITGSSILPDSIETAMLKDGSVTAIKLADNSSGVVTAGALADGVRIGQVGLSTTDNKLYVWDGSAWRGIAAPESVNGITVTDGLIEIAVTDNGDGTVTLAPSHKDTTAAKQFLAGPTNGAGVVSARAIVGADLPPATSTSNGVVTVSGGGLIVNGTGLISIDNAVPAQTSRSLVTYDANGLVQSGSPIEYLDLPLATSSTVGVVKPGSSMKVDGTGAISLDNAVAAGTYTKVDVNDSGLVTAGRALSESDIPDLSADKITGTLGTTSLEDKSVTKAKLANYSISYIQEAQPAITTADHVGILWYQESTAQLRMWNANSWMPVGFGRLSNENLRWGGLIDASTGLMTGVTAVGTTAGLTIGQPLPEATDALGGLYVLVSVAGDQISVIAGQLFDAGDWALCINEAEGWVRIDTATGGGGGGGGASVLNDLLDVTLTGPSEGQFLSLAGSGQWTNVSEIDGGGF